MKVKLLKDHLEAKKGEVIEVDSDRGNYLIRCHVAEEVKEKAKSKQANKQN